MKRALFFLIAYSLVAVSPAHSKELLLEETLAWRMLQLEKDARPFSDGPAVTPEKEALLRQVLLAMVESTRYLDHTPRNAAQAIAVTETAASQMAELNMMQPARRENWVSSIGEALRPVELEEDAFARLARYPGNSNYSGLHRADEPIYYVDCDIASLLLISAFQMRGWEVALVEVPDHNFIRWTLESGERLNWDWTYGASQSDSWYLGMSGRHASRSTLMESVALRSMDADSAEGYYGALIARRIPDQAKKLAVFQSALSVDHVSQTTHYNAGYYYAMDPDFGLDYETAVLAAYRASLAWPGRAASTANLACVINRGGDRAQAISLQEWAVERIYDIEHREVAQANLGRMRRGEPCRWAS